MAMYIYELKHWPSFQWDEAALLNKLADVRHSQGRLIGSMQSLGFKLQAEAVLQTLTDDVLKSSEIEGEVLGKEQVRSSIARRLGMDIGALVQTDRNVEGVVEMMLDATQNYSAPLTTERLYDWHATLFPTGRSGMTKITVSAWRTDQTGPMQVVSGRIGRQKVHYEAPPSTRLDHEMSVFLKWFETPAPIDPVLKAALAHLWFVTIHPFDDGNGRIARAIADMALARSENSPQRFYSMSTQIQIERNAYYSILEDTQKGNLDVTSWIIWFLECFKKAIVGAESTLDQVMAKARFWNRHSGALFNERQLVMVNKMIDGFEGKLTSSKWAVIMKCSQDTALRDIDDLIRRGVLVQNQGGGRSTSYSLNLNALVKN